MAGVSRPAGGCTGFLALLAAVVIGDLATMTYAVLKGPFPIAVALGAPTAYLNIFVHVPLAITSYVVFTVALAASILYLWKREERWDRIAYGAVVVGELYGVFTIVTGMAWASESWGAAWNWDPRETGVLLLVLGYLGYFALRSSIPDPERRRLVSSAYAVAAYSLVPLSYAAPLIFHSLHPSFKEAQSFMWTGPAGPLIGARMLFALSTGVLLALAPYVAATRGCPSKPILGLAAAALVFAAAAAAYVGAPYLAGDPVRIVDAGLEDGRISYVVLGNGTRVDFPEPVESPVKPAVRSDGLPSVIGHVALVARDSIVVVRHWCVAFNMAMYGLLIALSLAAASMLRGRLAPRPPST